MNQFRLWDNLDKKMILPVTFNAVIEAMDLNLKFPKRYILNHALIRPDMDGQTIYQGDILEFTDYQAGETTEEVRIVGEVVTSDWGFDLTNRVNVDLADIDLGKCKVKGNIYENPDRLYNPTYPRLK